MPGGALIKQRNPWQIKGGATQCGHSMGEVCQVDKGLLLFLLNCAIPSCGSVATLKMNSGTFWLSTASSIGELEAEVQARIKPVASSSVRSVLVAAL